MSQLVVSEPAHGKGKTHEEDISSVKRLWSMTFRSATKVVFAIFSLWIESYRSVVRSFLLFSCLLAFSYLPGLKTCGRSRRGHQMKWSGARPALIVYYNYNAVCFCDIVLLLFILTGWYAVYGKCVFLEIAEMLYGNIEALT